jgi:glycosyltransferase involved in cell wall biosynthesis
VRELERAITFQADIVGDGPLRDALEEQVRQLSLRAHVQFHGRLPQLITAAELLRKSDLMVLPSVRECSGAVVLEATASAVPVIATPMGTPEVCIESDIGILIQAHQTALSRNSAMLFYDLQRIRRCANKWAYEDVLNVEVPD